MSKSQRIGVSRNSSNKILSPVVKLKRMEDTKMKSSNLSSPVDLACQNPVILDTIFKELDVEELYNLRHVCKQWNNCATRELQINWGHETEFSCDIKDENGLQRLNELNKLMESPSSENTPRWLCGEMEISFQYLADDRITEFRNFLQKYGKHVHKLTIFISRREERQLYFRSFKRIAMPIVHTILTKWCKNLEEFYIFTRRELFARDLMEPPMCSKYWVPPNYNRRSDYQLTFNEPLKLTKLSTPLFEPDFSADIVSATEHLESLTLVYEGQDRSQQFHTFFEIIHCNPKILKKVKSLNLTDFDSYHSILNEFSMPKLSVVLLDKVMLGVRNQKLLLTPKSVWVLQISRMFIPLKFPIDYTDIIGGLERFHESLSQFKNLNSLGVLFEFTRGTDRQGKARIFDPLLSMTPLPNLRMLSLDDSDLSQLSSVESIVKTFPNITNIHLEIDHEKWVSIIRPKCSSSLSEIFTCLSQLNHLQKLSISKHTVSPRELMEGMMILKMFKALIELDISNIGSYEISDVFNFNQEDLSDFYGAGALLLANSLKRLCLVNFDVRSWMNYSNSNAVESFRNAASLTVDTTFLEMRQY